MGLQDNNTCYDGIVTNKQAERLLKKALKKEGLI